MLSINKLGRVCIYMVQNIVFVSMKKDLSWSILFENFKDGKGRYKGITPRFNIFRVKLIFLQYLHRVMSIR